VRCLGLNYEKHAKEVRSGDMIERVILILQVKYASPKIPCSICRLSCHPNILQVLICSQYKPITSLTGPTDPIPVHPLAQEGTGLDYECELVAIIGKTCADVPESKALDYVLGYAIGNDVSHREWQLQRGCGQWALGKGFDGWAPYGPGIVSSKIIKNPQSLSISTKVNGKTVQESSTADMIFGVAKTIAFLSQGTTLLPGDLIFTGTPQGVGMGRKPQLWLKDGDVVEVGLEGVRTCTNKVEFTKAKAKL